MPTTAGRRFAARGAGRSVWAIVQRCAATFGSNSKQATRRHSVQIKSRPGLFARVPTPYPYPGEPSRNMTVAALASIHQMSQQNVWAMQGSDTNPKSGSRLSLMTGTNLK